MSWPVYPQYKPSGVEWLGDVPEHWAVRRLKTVARFGYGDSLAADDRVAGPCKVYGSNGVVDQHDRANTLSPCLIIGRKGSFGKVAFSDKQCFAIDTTYFVDSRQTTANLRWLYYVLQWLRLDSVSKDSAVPGLSREDAYDNLLTYCPLPEQRAIAAFLDRETARIDALIEKKQRQSELLKEKRSALISHVVTKGLDPNVKMKDSGIEWLGEVPEHWKVIPIKRVARMDSGHTPDKKVEAYWTDCNIPWVSLNDTAYLKDHDYIEDTVYHVNKLGLANSSAHLLPARVVIFTRDATIGLSAITTRPMAVSQHIIAWLCGPRIIPEYLLRVFYTMTQELERLCMGSTIRTLGMPDVLELVTPLPPLEEQEQIARISSEQIPKIDFLITKVQESINKLHEYRSALISAAVTGKIDVRKEVF